MRTAHTARLEHISAVVIGYVAAPVTTPRRASIRLSPDNALRRQR